jgi:hypothetical protein
VCVDCLCGLVVRVPGCRSRGPGSILGATRISEKWWVWNGVHSATWVQMKSYLKKSSGSGLESRKYGHRDPSRWSRGTLYPQKLALTSPTSGGCSVGIVRSRTQATEFSLLLPNNKATIMTWWRPQIMQECISEDLSQLKGFSRRNKVWFLLNFGVHIISNFVHKVMLY